MTLFDRWRDELARLAAAGRLRQLRPPQGIDFSSNDYLGYGREPVALPSELLSPSGLASRLLRGDHPIWSDVETRLARWHGAEATLFFNSGYAANEGLLATVIQPGDWVASDQANHASIIDGLRLTKAERFIFRHNDLNHLENELRQAHAKRAASRQMFVVTESLFGMEGDRAPLVEMAAVAERFAAHFIVDEAHATGCFGPTGSGLVDSLGLRSRVLATMHTGGKALGVQGAYVCGGSLLKDVLVNRCRHSIFTTAPAPLLATFWLSRLERVSADTDRRERLHRAATLFRQRIAPKLACGFATCGPSGSKQTVPDSEHVAKPQASFDAADRDYIVPIVLGDDTRAVRVASALQAAGFDIRAIRPPTVPIGTARLRIAIHANHSDDLLIRLADQLKNPHAEVDA